MHKKILSFFLGSIFLGFLLLLGTQVAFAFSGSGAGTSGDPFIITSCVQLQEMGSALSSYYKIGDSDIDCSATSTWNSGAGFVPVGVFSSKFLGTLNGNGKKITGLFINRPTDTYVGLFGWNAGTVINVGLESVNITGGGSTTGSFAASNQGTITRSYSTGSVSGGTYVGGLVAGNFGTISNSYSTVSGAQGGLVGLNNGGSVVNSYSTGSASVGGLVSENINSATVINSFWDTQTSGQATSAGGAGVTGELTSAMKTGSTFTSATWDFTTIWDIKSFTNNGYPFLRATTGAVTTTGGTVVYGFWNSSNTGLNITVPIANDANLVGGTIQVQRADSGGGFFNLGTGDPYTIISGDLNTNKTLSFTAFDLKNSEGFVQGDNVAFTVVITDHLDNVTTYTQSADTLTVDQIAPTVTNVTSTLDDGTYTTGQVIPITVTFSEPVIVTNNPQLNLATGNPETTLIDYSSGSGTNTLTFNYTVAAGNHSVDLDYFAYYSVYFVVSGSTIKDAEGNQANAALAEPGEEGSLGNNKNIVINNTTPTDINISITSTGSGTDGTYIIGDTVTASWNNTVDGDAVADINQVTFDFSQFGGGVVTASDYCTQGDYCHDGSNNIWTASYQIIAGSINTTNRNVSLTTIDNTDHSITTLDTTNSTVNNVVPIVNTPRRGGGHPPFLTQIASSVVGETLNAIPANSTVSPIEKIIDSGECPANLIITDNMEKGDRNGKYSDYNKGTVKQVKILQAHINRILASAYNQAAGPIDGIYGKLTKQGVGRLQAKLNIITKPNSLLKIDGIVGQLTKEAINKSCGK